MLKKYVSLNLCITQDVFKIWNLLLTIEGENYKDMDYFLKVTNF